MVKLTNGILLNLNYCSIVGEIRRLKSGDCDGEAAEINGNDELVNNNLDMSVDEGENQNNDIKDVDMSINTDA